MPGQNFIATDFIVASNEAEALKAIGLLPHHRPNITLLKENPLLKTLRFLYEHSDKSVKNYVDVSILPQDALTVRCCLHGSYTNGQPVHTDQSISTSLHDFEQLVHAALANDLSGLSSLKTVLTNQKDLFSFWRFFSGTQVKITCVCKSWFNPAALSCHGEGLRTLRQFMVEYAVSAG